MFLTIVSVEPFSMVNFVGEVKDSLALNANIEKQVSPSITHIALSCVAVTCPHSAVTRTGRADFFSCCGGVHAFSHFASFMRLKPT